VKKGNIRCLCFRGKCLKNKAHHSEENASIAITLTFFKTALSSCQKVFVNQLKYVNNKASKMLLKSLK